MGSQQDGGSQNKNNAATRQNVPHSHDLVWPVGLLNIAPEEGKAVLTELRGWN